MSLLFPKGRVLFSTVLTAASNPFDRVTYSPFELWVAYTARLWKSNQIKPDAERDVSVIS